MQTTKNEQGNQRNVKHHPAVTLVQLFVLTHLVTCSQAQAGGDAEAGPVQGCEEVAEAGPQGQHPAVHREPGLLPTQL